MVNLVFQIKNQLAQQCNKQQNNLTAFTFTAHINRRVAHTQSK